MSFDTVTDFNDLLTVDQGQDQREYLISESTKVANVTFEAQKVRTHKLQKLAIEHQSIAATKKKFIEEEMLQPLDWMGSILAALDGRVEIWDMGCIEINLKSTYKSSITFVQ